MFEQIKSILVSDFGIDEIAVTMEATFKDDFAMDSLSMVEMVMKVEDEFNLEIPEEDVASIMTVGDVVRYIESK